MSEANGRNQHPESKECGLHVVDGKLVRIKSVQA